MPDSDSSSRLQCHPVAHGLSASLQTHAQCLNGTSAVFVGISETIELLEWLQTELRCCHHGHRLVQRFKFCTRKWSSATLSGFRSTAICKQNLYTDTPYHAECSAFATRATCVR